MPNKILIVSFLMLINFAISSPPILAGNQDIAPIEPSAVTILRQKALEFSERNALKSEDVFNLRENELNFIKNEIDLKRVHSNLTRKLTNLFASYKEIDPTVHYAHILSGSIASTTVTFFSGLTNFLQENRTFNAIILGSAQVGAFSVLLSTAVISYPHLANWLHSLETNYWIVPTFKRISLLPFHYSNEQIEIQSSFIALYMLAINESRSTKWWDDKTHVQKMVKSILEARKDNSYSLIYYLDKIDL